MANTQSGNSVYIDTVGIVNEVPVNVLSITITATTANAIVNLTDTKTALNKLNLRLVTAGTSQVFHFEDAPLFFQGGVTASIVTNCIVTIVMKPKGQ